MITIYTTPNCTYCVQVKNYLKSLNIDFISYDVSQDIDKKQEMVSMTGQLGVPVIRIENDVIIGFNKPKIDKILKENNLV